MAAYFKLGRQCACGTPVSDKSKTGNCLRCNLRMQNSDPAIIAKRTERFRQMLRDNPAELERRRVQMKLNRRNGLKAPEAQERRRATALRNLLLAHTPEATAKQRAGIPAAVQKGWDRRLAWCPMALRAEYHELVKRFRKSSAEARRIIEGRMRAELAALSPFERQMRALENGAKIVANDAKPSGNQVVRRFG